MTKKIEKLREELASKIESKLNKVKTATKAHEMLEVVDWFDQDMFDFGQKVCTKLQEGKYFETNDLLDEFYANN